jgi:hypothetical protein
VVETAKLSIVKMSSSSGAKRSCVQLQEDDHEKLQGLTDEEKSLEAKRAYSEYSIERPAVEVLVLYHRSTNWPIRFCAVKDTRATLLT